MSKEIRKQPPAGKFTKKCRKHLEQCAYISPSEFMLKDACDIIDRESEIKAELLTALKRAYFLLEKNHIEDQYFEILRLKLGSLLPSQIVDMRKMKSAIAKAKG